MNLSYFCFEDFSEATVSNFLKKIVSDKIKKPNKLSYLLVRNKVDYNFLFEIPVLRINRPDQYVDNRMKKSKYWIGSLVDFLEESGAKPSTENGKDYFGSIDGKIIDALNFSVFSPEYAWETGRTVMPGVLTEAEIAERKFRLVRLDEAKQICLGTKTSFRDFEKFYVLLKVLKERDSIYLEEETQRRLVSWHKLSGVDAKETSVLGGSQESE